MPPNAVDGSLESLKALVKSTTRLTVQLEKTVTSISSEKIPDSYARPLAHDAAAATSVDVLALAHDSASLIRAHGTKLSLLIINVPFTPSAIMKVLRELVAGPIPAIASAVQLCAADTHTTVVRQHLAWKCRHVLHELHRLVKEIPLDGQVLPSHRKNGANGDRGSIVTTGVLWAACDEVIALKKLGITGILAKTVEEHRDTLQDTLEELKEWSEVEDEEDSEEDEDVQDIANELQNTHISAQQMIDDLMTSHAIPRDDPDRIRERLDLCLKRLRLIILLYSAIIKRRVNTLPSLPTEQASPIIRRVDEVYLILRRLPPRFDEVASMFYDLNAAAIDEAMDQCFLDAFAAAEMLKAPWTGTKDVFTEWADKFQISIKKPD
ncbi:hypothetical protein FHL15_010058 [Xylaria flabelliformis]|uniref:Cyclin-D1-binding protein 1-like N-terminal domain-containing protein n=1 Tax=Xylaria flabelliformis TaxID=2512241 RepID=A0A553HM58_9PEZI|nr:hypothetical protein FHL15_010058 [Xylaria flabelliformis]